MRWNQNGEKLWELMGTGTSVMFSLAQQKKKIIRDEEDAKAEPDGFHLQSAQKS